MLACVGHCVVDVSTVARQSGFAHGDATICEAMPDAMRAPGAVQFFSWFALFAMWIYTTSAVTQVHFGTKDTTSIAYNDGANWVGVLFAAYNGFAVLAAICIPM